jgi:hypothetical protein
MYENRIVKEQMAIVDRQLKFVPTISFDTSKKEKVIEKKAWTPYEIKAQDKVRDSNFHIATAKVHKKEVNTLELPEVEQRRLQHL